MHISFSQLLVCVLFHCFGKLRVRENEISLYKSSGGPERRRTRRGTKGAVAPPGLKNFRANSVFRASTSFSKILNDKKYLNTVNIFRATLFFGASASCSKILNNKKYIFSTVKSGHPLFFRASASYSKIRNVKSIFNTVKIFRATLFFRASASCSKILNVKSIFNAVKFFRATLFFQRTSASCSKILNDEKYLFNTVKNSRANSVFQDKRKLLKNSECEKHIPYTMKIFRATFFFRASASCSKILNDKKYLNTAKNSRVTLFFRASASCSKS